MPFRVISPEDFEWITRPHDEGEPARHVAELSDMAKFAHGSYVKQMVIGTLLGSRRRW